MKGNQTTQNPDPKWWRLTAKELIIILATSTLYVLVFFPVYRLLGSSTVALVLIPIVAVTWVWGLRIGLVYGVVGILLNTGLLTFLSVRFDAHLLLGSLPGYTVTLLIVLAVGRFRDVHLQLQQQLAARAEIEQALTKNQALLAGVLNSSLNAVMAFSAVRDEDGRLLDLACNLVNPKAEQILQQPAADLIGLCLLANFPGQGKEQLFAKCAGVLETGAPLYTEYLINEEPDERWLQIQAGRLQDGITITFSDVTERRQYEARLRAAKAAAEQAAQVKSEFLANMSHEIRTPLNAIVGLTGLLLDSPLAPQQQEFVEILRTSSDGLLTIINDILDFSKIEAGKLEIEQQPFSLRACVEEAVDLLRPKACEKGLDLVCRIDKDAPAIIMGDVTRLRQVLVNLLGNAVKFTQAGRVIVSVTSEVYQGASLEFLVSVQDTGIGIPPQHVGRLFTSFSQADSSMTRRFGGTGLGLAISKRLVQAMNGRIWVESEPGQGATFSFTFVAEALAGPDLPVAVAQTRLPALSGHYPLHILLAEDNVVNQKVALHMLERMGYRADVVGNGLEAVEALRQRAYDVVLMDVQMPEMDGEEATMTIRRVLSPTRQPYIIALTANALQGDRERFLALGMDDYLSKPVRFETLAAALTIAGQQPAANAAKRPLAPAYSL